MTISPPSENPARGCRSSLVSDDPGDTIGGNGPERGNKPPLVGWTQRLEHQFSVRVGALDNPNDSSFRGPIPEGVRMGLLTEGRLSGQMEAGRSFDMKGPSVFILASNNQREGEYALPKQKRIKFVSVLMDIEAIDANGLPLDKILGNRLSFSDTRFCHKRADDQLQSLAVQIANCPFQGGIRDLYLAGKALEFAALISNSLCIGTPSACELCSDFCVRDVKRIYEARNLLLASIEEPPKLDELSRAVGVNSKKLTAGFRAIFGKSPAEVLKDYRFEQAYMMLTTGELNVSQVAYRVGYSVAHFSTAFRKRFGISPKELC